MDEAWGRREYGPFHCAQHKHIYKTHNFIIVRRILLLLFPLHNIFSLSRLVLHYKEIVFISGSVVMTQMTLPNKPMAELRTELCRVTVHYFIHWIPNKILLFCLFVCKVNITKESICQEWRHCFFPSSFQDTPILRILQFASNQESRYHKHLQGLPRGYLPWEKWQKAWGDTR